ncbi:MAG TPA: zinc-binding dehydrogenase [Gammaproteobacteria bacterium]|nr:zinc-binding dehydrogenase [Gammaproteobacteria bacterium]HKH20435.1 zinc-binding dehydrogenase [Gammaproteobacteria bacterium]
MSVGFETKTYRLAGRRPRTAMLLGAERIIAIDRFDYRLEQMGAEVINYEQTDVAAALRKRRGGRDPDVCIEAVGRESHTPRL